MIGIYLLEDHELDIWKPTEFIGSKPLLLTSTPEKKKPTKYSNL